MSLPARPSRTVRRRGARAHACRRSEVGPSTSAWQTRGCRHCVRALSRMAATRHRGPCPTPRRVSPRVPPRGWPRPRRRARPGGENLAEAAHECDGVELVDGHGSAFSLPGPLLPTGAHGEDPRRVLAARCLRPMANLFVTNMFVTMTACRSSPLAVAANVREAVTEPGRIIETAVASCARRVSNASPCGASPQRSTPDLPPSTSTSATLRAPRRRARRATRSVGLKAGVTSEGWDNVVVRVLGLTPAS